MQAVSLAIRCGNPVHSRSVAGGVAARIETLLGAGLATQLPVAGWGEGGGGR